MAERNVMSPIVPVGAIEQHGPHLPIMVDSRLVAAVAMRTASKLGERGETALVYAHHLDRRIQAPRRSAARSASTMRPFGRKNSVA